MPNFSISKIETFDNCPLQYRYQYIDCVEVEAVTTVEAYLGQKVHQALEKLYRDKLHEKSLSLDELLGHFQRLWQEEPAESLIIVKKDYTAENYRRMGERFLTDYYNRYKPFNQGRVLGLETKDLLSLDTQGNYKFHIRIDRLVDRGQGSYEVHDYKTNSSLPRQEELDEDRQLAMYALWVRRRFKDFKNIRLVWHFLAFDKEMESFRTDEQMQQLREEILARIQEIEAAREFPPRLSFLCDWCLYKPICPMWKHGVELEEKSENEYLDDPGVKLVDEYVRTKNEYDEYREEAEKKLEKLKQALVSFCEKEGFSVVFGSEKKITVKEQEAIKFPAKNTEERDKLTAVLKGIGRWEDVSELDTYTLARILKNSEWPEDHLALLRSYQVLEKTSRLTVAKK